MKTGSIHIKKMHTAAHRLDPSLHLSEGVKVREQLHDLPFELKSLDSVTESIFLGNIFSRIWVKDKEHGVPYLAASDTVLANLNTGQFLAKKQALDMPQLLLKSGWILITCSGTLGNTSYTNKNYAGKMATHDLIRVIPDEKKLPGGYVYAFLTGKYGYYQITQSQFGGVVKHINAAQAGQIQIPILSTDLIVKVDEMIKESAHLRAEAADALEKVHKMFEQELSLKISPISSEVSIKNIVESKGLRLEATIHTADAKAYLRAITSQFPYKRVKEMTAHVFTESIFKREYVENGHPFMMGSEILKSIPTASKSISYRQAANMPHLLVKEGWILMTCSGSVGDVAYVDKQLTQFVYTHDLIRIVPTNETTQLYLFGFLSSPIGKQLVDHFKYGSVIQHLEAFHVEDIPVPILPYLQKDVVENVSKHVESIYRSKQLELDAISMVEAEIEKWNKE